MNYVDYNFNWLVNRIQNQNRIEIQNHMKEYTLTSISFQLVTQLKCHKT